MKVTFLFLWLVQGLYHACEAKSDWNGLRKFENKEEEVSKGNAVDMTRSMLALSAKEKKDIDGEIFHRFLQGDGANLSLPPMAPAPTVTPPVPAPVFNECDTDLDCIDAAKYDCISNKCVLTNCEIGVDGKDCCSDTDCDGGFCYISYTCVKQGNPSFTLKWFGDDDLDLHVLPPGGEEINWVTTTDAISGGELDHDDIPLEQAPANPFQNWVENINFPLTGNPQGTFTYWVHNFPNEFPQPNNGVAEPWELTSYIGETVQSVHYGVVQFNKESERFTLEL